VRGRGQNGRLSYDLKKAHRQGKKFINGEMQRRKCLGFPRRGNSNEIAGPGGGCVAKRRKRFSLKKGPLTKSLVGNLAKRSYGKPRIYRVEKSIPGSL